MARVALFAFYAGVSEKVQERYAEKRSSRTELVASETPRDRSGFRRMMKRARPAQGR